MCVCVWLTGVCVWLTVCVCVWLIPRPSHWTMGRPGNEARYGMCVCVWLTQVCSSILTSQAFCCPIFDCLQHTHKKKTTKNKRAKFWSKSACWCHFWYKWCWSWKWCHYLPWKWCHYLPWVNKGLRGSQSLSQSFCTNTWVMNVCEMKTLLLVSGRWTCTRNVYFSVVGSYFRLSI